MYFILAEASIEKIQHSTNMNFLWSTHNIKQLSEDNYLKTVSISGDFLGECQYASFYFFTTFEPPVMIINSDDIHYVPSSLLFIFVSKLNHFSLTLQNVTIRRYYNPRFIIIILCETLSSESDLEFIVSEIWKSKILKYSLVYQLNGVNVVTYDPFQNKIINQTNKPFYIKQFKDLYGHKLKVAVFKDYPKNMRNKDGIWTGDDIKLLNRYLKHKNATVELVEAEEFGNLIHKLIDKSIDFLFIPVQMKLKYFNFSHINYPFFKDNFIALIPQSDMAYGSKSLFVFSWDHLIILVLLSIILSLFGSKSRASSELFYDSLSVLITQSLQGFKRRKTIIKFLLMFWMLGGIVMTISFESTLIIKLVKPESQNTIETIRDLSNSDMNINIKELFLDMIPESYGLHKRMIVSPYSEIFKKISDNVNEAFILPSSKAEALVAIFPEEHLDRRYRQMRDYIVPSYSVYMFPVNSPYLNDVNKFIIRSFEGGIAWNYINLHAKRRRGLYHHGRDLSLEHLKGSFYLLLLGLSISMVVFALEIVYSKYFP